MVKGEKERDQDSKARSVALRLLARREHSRLELSLKLRQRQLEQSVIDQVLDDYERHGWLDDQRFADIYARQRVEQGYGPLRIQSELQQRGIHDSPACVCAMTDDDWIRKAVAIRQKKFGLAPVNDKLDEKARQARFLGRRGFSGSQVECALAARASECWGDFP